MIFSKEQEKVLKDKKFGNKIVKGISNSGKSTSVIYRSLFLKDNYSLYDEDRILYLSSDSNKFNFINETINMVKNENSKGEISIFSILGKDIDIYTKENIAKKIYCDIFNKNENELNILECSETKKDIIKKLLTKYKEENKIRGKRSEEIFTEGFLMEEIKFIKSYSVKSLEEYLIIKRKGPNTKVKCLRKNSKIREYIYLFFKRYNEELTKQGYLEYEDLLYNIIANNKKYFVHMIIDSCEKLAPIELEFLNSIYNEKTYSERIFIIHTEERSPYSALLQGKRLTLKPLGNISRRFNFKFSVLEDSNKNVELSKEIDLMEHFKFIDLKRNREFDFKRDYGNLKDIVVVDGDKEDEYENDELKEIPMYSNIAAGEPIMMISEQEGLFYLPKYWMKGAKDCFILKVKGDSMINANIHHGDYVVIRQQFNAENRDIVAVNLSGNATLKRLYIDKNKVLLLPENEIYEPMKIDEDEGISILGVAVGIIKLH
ncbi:LexA family protein [Hathewaya histolytica]|uniref:LexA family protein n=1 Tax=Hathewaya histolytica TaxID=1498 RepID=UPI003B680DD5